MLKTPRHETFPLKAMLREHERELCIVLRQIVSHLKDRERDVREAIRAEGHLKDLLHSSWKYLFQAVNAASDASDESASVRAAAHVAMLLQMIEEVKSGLAARQLDPIEPWHTDTARKALEMLANILADPESVDDPGLHIEAFAALAEKHMHAIVSWLAAVDERLQETT